MTNKEISKIITTYIKADDAYTEALLGPDYIPGNLTVKYTKARRAITDLVKALKGDA